jgi:Tfp pilus assembly protein PilV
VTAGPNATRRGRDGGYAMIDVIMGLVLFGLVVIAIYQLFLPAFAYSRAASERLAVQQDARLAIDRLTRPLHETTLAPGRIRVYTARAGCAGEYEGCVGFATARIDDCTGPFQLQSGAPEWRASIYVWREAGTNELRMRCDPGTTFPAPRWPPPALSPYTVIGTRVVAVSFELLPPSQALPAAIAVTLQEQLPGAPGPGGRAADVFNHTVFVPENR